MLVAAAALGVLAWAGLVTPWVLLGLIFALGVGQAFTSPTWQALQPELVPADERQQAISFGAVNQNLARRGRSRNRWLVARGDERRPRCSSSTRRASWRSSR